jgi:hypothetical protein
LDHPQEAALGTYQGFSKNAGDDELAAHANDLAAHLGAQLQELAPALVASAKDAVRELGDEATTVAKRLTGELRTAVGHVGATARAELRETAASLNPAPLVRKRPLESIATAFFLGLGVALLGSGISAAREALRS